jgi:type II restriction/modification system DNA methylase subunit YeeA
MYNANSKANTTTIRRQIDATDRKIDQLVYQLYNLTDEEIKIIEESTK